MFEVLNAGKESVAVDLDSDEARPLIERLVDRSDVVLEDFLIRVNTVHRTWFDAVRPETILCSISGLGDRGPDAHLPVSELVVQALSGYTSSLGRVGDPPVRVGADVASMAAGHFAFQAVLAAIYRQRISGFGQRISVSMLGSLFFLRRNLWSALNDPDEWFGHLLDSWESREYTGYRTAGRPIFFSMGKGSDDDWYNLLLDLDMVDVLEDNDPRWSDYGRQAVGVGRYAHELKDRWERAFEGRDHEEVIALIEGYGGDAAPVNDYDGVQTMMHWDHQDLTEVLPFDRCLGTVARRDLKRAPSLGEHTSHVLKDIGFSGEEISGLLRAGVIHQNE